MGSSLSLFKKDQPQKSKIDSFFEDEEEPEVEVDLCAVLEKDCEKCKPYRDKFFPVIEFISDSAPKDLSGNTTHKSALDHLPEDIRHETVFNYLKAQEKLVVFIQVGEPGTETTSGGNGVSNASNKHHTQSESTDSSNETKKLCVGTESQRGSGYVYISDTIQEYTTCQIKTCNINNDHKCYGGLIVYTNKHVIKNTGAASESTVFFSYYHEQLKETDGQQAEKDAEIFKAYGNYLQVDQSNKDLIGLSVFYHYTELHDMVKESTEQVNSAWAKISPEIKKNMETYAIIVSHPHGRPKQITFGSLICLEEDDRDEKGRKVTKYDAATCKGSSGAPVFTGFYNYRPFIHSSKSKKVPKIGMSYSY